MLRLIAPLLLCLSMAAAAIPAAHAQRVLSGALTVNTVGCPAASPDTARLAQAHARHPIRRTSRDAAAVQQLYRVACGLPVVAGAYRTYNCPIDNGVVYHVTFLRRTTPLLAVTAKASGCEWLFVGGAAYRGRHAYWLTAGFWTALAAIAKSQVQRLTPTPDPTLPDVTVTAPPPSPQSAVLHLGQALTLLVPSVTGPSGPGPSWIVHADPGYLKLLASGPAASGSQYSYRWEAVAGGDAAIVLDPLCLPHGCKSPSLELRVTVLP